MTATNPTIDDRHVILAGIVLAVHFVTNAVHAIAHAEIPVVLDPALNLVVLLGFFVLPAVGVALLWRGSARPGAAVFTLGMAVSFVLGVSMHFLVSNPDHVSAVPPGDWQLPFQLSAVGFVATTAAGTALGAWIWQDLGSHERGRLPPTGRVEGVPDTGFRPLTRLMYWASRRQFGDVPAPLAVTAHHGRVLAGATAFEAALAGSNHVDERLKELAVLKAATLIECEFCIDFATAEALELGVTADQLRELTDYEESDAFSEHERLVLRYAVALTATPTDVPEALFDALAAEFDEAELVELTAAVAIENYRGRFNRAFGLDAQGFSDASCPRPAGPSENPRTPRSRTDSDQPLNSQEIRHE